MLPPICVCSFPFSYFIFVIFWQLSFICENAKIQETSRSISESSAKGAVENENESKRKAATTQVGGSRNNNGVDFISFLYPSRHLFFPSLAVFLLYFVCLLVSSCLDINTLKNRAGLLSFFIYFFLYYFRFRLKWDIKINSTSFCRLFFFVTPIFRLLHYLFANVCGNHSDHLLLLQI